MRLEKARQLPPKLSEEEKRRKAMEFQAQIQGKAEQAAGREKVTQTAWQTQNGVTTAEKTSQSAAEGRREDSKIAKYTAAPAPSETGGRRADIRLDGAGSAAAPERRKPNRRENEFMMNLMILRNTLMRNAPACRERARQAGKWVWRDIRLMLRLVNKTQDAMIKTMPEGRDEYYSAYARNGHYELRIDGPVRNARHVLISDMHLGAICEAAIENECLMCLREGNEITKCPLREALLEVAPPTEVREELWKRCEYRGAAGDLIHGRDVTI